MRWFKLSYICITIYRHMIYCHIPAISHHHLHVRTKSIWLSGRGFRFALRAGGGKKCLPGVLSLPEWIEAAKVSQHYNKRSPSHCLFFVCRLIVDCPLSILDTIPSSGIWECKNSNVSAWLNQKQGGKKTGGVFNLFWTLQDFFFFASALLTVLKEKQMLWRHTAAASYFSDLWKGCEETISLLQQYSK